MFQVGLWDQVLGMEQMGPICVSALSSGGILWKTNIFVRPSFVHFGFVHLVGCCGFGFRLGQERMRSIDLSCFVVLKQPGGRRCNSEATLVRLSSLFEYQMIM